TVLSTDPHATGAATRPANTAPYRPYLMLRSTERTLHSCAAQAAIVPSGYPAVGHETLTNPLPIGSPGYAGQTSRPGHRATGGRAATCHGVRGWRRRPARGWSRGRCTAALPPRSAAPGWPGRRARRRTR